MAKIKVLLAEDHVIVREGTAKLVRAEPDMEVVGEADNGEEAIRLFKDATEKPDIIIMDHRMPIKNGIEATKEIIRLYNHTKIIFASADISVREEALSIGAFSFLEKPFSIASLTLPMCRGPEG